MLSLRGAVSDEAISVFGQRLLRFTRNDTLTLCHAVRVLSHSLKIGTVAEEADESVFWLELIMDGGLLKPDIVVSLHQEAEELTAIFTASGRTAKQNNQQSKIRNPQC